MGHPSSRHQGCHFPHKAEGAVGNGAVVPSWSEGRRSREAPQTRQASLAHRSRPAPAGAAAGAPRGAERRGHGTGLRAGLFAAPRGWSAQAVLVSDRPGRDGQQEARDLVQELRCWAGLLTGLRTLLPVPRSWSCSRRWPLSQAG